MTPEQTRAASWWPRHLAYDEAAPRRGVHCAALFDEDRAYRYALTRYWAAGSTCAFVMLNPSTADHEVDDPTIRRCVGFAERWGFGSLLVLNLFAVRATDPRVMRAFRDPVGPDNDAVIAAALTRGYDVRRVVFAWGSHGTHRGRDLVVSRLVRSVHPSPVCLGSTKAGQPAHPLYLRADSPAVAYQDRMVARVGT